MSLTLDLCDDIGLEYEIYPDWDGPIWNGSRFIFDPTDRYGDIGQFHELMHWVMADDWQRIYPDLALGKNVNAGNNWTSSKFGPPIKSYHPSCGDQPSWGGEERVCKKDAGHQESLSTCAIGIYSLLEPKFTDEVMITLGDFTAWPWPEFNHDIVKYVKPYLKIDGKKTYNHLEKLRKSWEEVE